MPITHIGKSAPNRRATDIIKNDIQREHQFYMTSLATYVSNNERLITAEQRINFSTRWIVFLRTWGHW